MTEAPHASLETARVTPGTQDGQGHGSLGGYLVGELQAAGIRAQLRDRYPVYAGALRAEILCFEPDQERAVEIIDDALAKQHD